MKRALALVFTVALLSVSLFAAAAIADPAPPGGTNGLCNNNPGALTPNGNAGWHMGLYIHCATVPPPG